MGDDERGAHDAVRRDACSAPEQFFSARATACAGKTLPPLTERTSLSGGTTAAKARRLATPRAVRER